ncbi:pentapeptide repeat-containing protein [Crocosphaera sp.]|nr:pentapeptide repeat-containing protein [Crocosphaera sp.]
MKIDLSDADLSGANLSGSNLSNACFIRANLSGA